MTATATKADLNNLETRLDKRFEKVDKQFDRIAKVIVKGFDRIDKVLEEKADKVDLQRVFDLLDKIAKQQEIDNDERLVMGHQLDRLDRWVHDVADKIGYKLSV